MAEKYKEWEIRGFSGAFMGHGMNFIATSPDYDVDWKGAEEGWVASGDSLIAETVDELKKKIDELIEENSDAE